MAMKRRVPSPSEQLRSQAQQKAKKKRAAQNLESTARRRAGLTLKEADARDRTLRASKQRTVLASKRVRDLEKSVTAQRGTGTRAAEVEDQQLRASIQRRAQNKRALRELATKSENLRRKRR